MTRPFFSIFSAGRNAGFHVERMLQGVMGQRFCNWQLVLVDDASTDNSFALALDGFPSDQRFVCVRNSERKRKLQNFLDCWRAGYMTGEVIVELDADDALCHTSVLDYLALLYADGADATTGAHFVGNNPALARGPTLPVRGSRIAAAPFAALAPAPRTWRSDLTRLHLEHFPDSLIDPTTQAPWRFNADMALFYPALCLAQRAVSPDVALAYITRSDTGHDYIESPTEQAREAAAITAYWYEHEPAAARI